MRIAYADPPYPGMSRLYKDHPDYAGEVDHARLALDLLEYDAWVLHTAASTLAQVLAHFHGHLAGVRILAWTKTFASFKPSQTLAYAWEPVIVKPGRDAQRSEDVVMRDWLAEPITLQKGLTGAKPPRVVDWCLRAIGAEPDDELDDLFPGTGAVTRAWEAYRAQTDLFGRAANPARSGAPETTERML